MVRVPLFRVVPSFGILHLGMPSGRISASGSSLVHGNSVEVEAQATLSAYMFEVLDHSDQRSASEIWLRRNEGMNRQSGSRAVWVGSPSMRRRHGYSSGVFPTPSPPDIR